MDSEAVAVLTVIGLLTVGWFWGLELLRQRLGY
jgi:hypothetical protein